MQDDTVKVTFRIDKEVAEELKREVPWGNRERIVSQLIAAATGAIKSDGSIMYGAILTGEFQLVLSLRSRGQKRAKT